MHTHEHLASKQTALKGHDSQDSDIAQSEDSELWQQVASNACWSEDLLGLRHPPLALHLPGAVMVTQQLWRRPQQKESLSLPKTDLSELDKV